MKRCITSVRSSFRVGGLYRSYIPVLASCSSQTKRNLTSSAAHQAVALTREVYKVNKGPYKKIDTADVDFFSRVLGKAAVLTDPSEIAGYNEDWMQKYRGESSVVLKPRSTSQVSEILKYCNDKRIALVPQGGNTGLVGGSVPVFDEVILSMANMNTIRHFDDVSGVLVADAGLVLEVADQFLADKGYIFPLDLGAKGSCHLGGNVATNAGGLRLLRYGSLHGSVLGLEIVLADGTVVNSLSKLRKDNTGYDIKQLFIGSEGTLGVITAVSVICPPRPTSSNVAFLGLESYEAVQKVFVSARRHINEILSAFEFMDEQSQSLVNANTELPRPLDTTHPFYVLIETSGSNMEHDSAKLEAFLSEALESGTVANGVLAQDDTQIKSLWNWREGIPEASGKAGGVYKYDVSLPLPSLYSLVEDTRKHLKQAGVMGPDPDQHPVVDVIGYGHIGDSNLHLNVAVRGYSSKIEALLEPYIFEWISKNEGSISAEHGLGFSKRSFAHYSRSSESLDIMRNLKKQFDPNNVLSPYKFLEW